MSMTAGNYNELLRNSLEFRRAWQVQNHESDAVFCNLESTDLLAVGLFLQLLNATRAWINNIPISSIILPYYVNEDRVKTPSAPVSYLDSRALCVLDRDNIQCVLARSKNEPVDDVPAWPDPTCFTLIHAPDGVQLSSKLSDQLSNVVLRPLGTVAPLFWSSKLFIVVTPENAESVDILINKLKMVVGDPGLDTLFLYEKLQHFQSINPNEVAEMREEILQLKRNISDIADYSRRFALGKSINAKNGRPLDSVSGDIKYIEKMLPSGDWQTETSDEMTLRGQIGYAHNQIAFLTAHLSSQLPTKITDRELLSRTPLFDAGWYASTYRVRPRSSIDHYLNNGYTGRFDPSLIFSSSNYYAANPDVAEEKRNPLVHYLRFGAEEGRPLSLATT